MSRWEKRQAPSKGARWAKAFVLALVVQVPLLYMIQVLLDSRDGLSPMNPLKHESVAELELTRDESASANSEDEIEEYQSREALEEIDGTELPIGQIVEIAPPQVEEIPDHANVSARYASKVKEEIRALKPTEDKTPSRVPFAPKKSAIRERKASRGEQGSDKASVKPPASATDDVPAPAEVGTEGAREAMARPLQREGGAVVSPSDAGKDSFENVRSLGRPYASDDFLEPIEKTGDTNVLNTMPYRYIGFFERVKAGVRREWSPNNVYRHRDPTGELYGYKDRMTVLRVVLDRNGYLEDTTVLKTSGLKFLDEEAKRAMWAASPFINPPNGLLKDDSKIRFEFGFVFLIASSKNRVFWKLQ
ncbi:MAG: TonB family protein [Pseudomonadota bacterium]